MFDGKNVRVSLNDFMSNKGNLYCGFTKDLLLEKFLQGSYSLAQNISPQLLQVCVSIYNVIIQKRCILYANLSGRAMTLKIINKTTASLRFHQLVNTCLDCNWTRTQNHLVLKRTLNHLAKLDFRVWIHSETRT